MAILTFDIGGTSVKYGVWADESITVQSFATPDTWAEMKETMVEIKESFAVDYDLEGVAISAPGTVDKRLGQIVGVSAIEYIHFFPIFDELEYALGLPVTIENDANCAALAEYWRGVGKNADSMLLVVIGTGIGGAFIHQGKLYRGANLSAGEFGMMLVGQAGDNWSQSGSPVNLAKRHANRTGETVEATAVYERAEQGDAVAIEEVAYQFESLARGLYNLTFVFDPEIIAIGGGFSNKPDLIDSLYDTMYDLVDRYNLLFPYRPNLQTCYFKNDANLIGAVYHFKQEYK